MQVEDLYNYGQDIFSMRANSQVPPLEKLKLLPAFLSYYGNLVRALGLHGVIRLRRNALREFEHWRQKDWSHLRNRGLSQENLERILKEMSTAKVMAQALGLKKAAHLRRRLSSRVAQAVLQAVFAPPEVFIALGEGDFLPPFKKYYAALLEAMDREGLQAGQIVEDTSDLLQVNITYCAWAEVARSWVTRSTATTPRATGMRFIFPSWLPREASNSSATAPWGKESLPATTVFRAIRRNTL
jgi:hypothetical protein